MGTTVDNYWNQDFSRLTVKVYKELERLLAEKNAEISCEEAIEVAKTIYAVKITDPGTGNTSKQTLLLTEEQKYLADLFNF